MDDSVIVVAFFLFMLVMMGIFVIGDSESQRAKVECLDSGHSIEECEQIFN